MKKTPEDYFDSGTVKDELLDYRVYYLKI